MGADILALLADAERLVDFSSYRGPAFSALLTSGSLILAVATYYAARMNEHIARDDVKALLSDLERVGRPQDPAKYAHEMTRRALFTARVVIVLAGVELVVGSVCPTANVLPLAVALLGIGLVYHATNSMFRAVEQWNAFARRIKASGVYPLRKSA